MTKTAYLLDNADDEAGHRFSAMSGLFDRGSMRAIATCGLSPGWSCWEVGAGGPALSAWMAQQVGAGGRVLATDLDTRWMQSTVVEGLEVRRHDVVADPVPSGPFDLIHARLLLVHLPERESVMSKMIAALRPGGWLVIEDADPALQPLACLDPQEPGEHRANRIRGAFRALMAGRGVDLAFGRTLPRRLQAAGLEAVRATCSFPIGGQDCDLLEAATVRMQAVKMIAEGAVSQDEIDQHLAAIAAGEFDLAPAPMISAMGRRPLDWQCPEEHPRGGVSENSN
jgi:SAM-dependent methyltransferase